MTPRSGENTSMNKRIFKYYNGFNDVYADPMEVDYKFIRATENEDMETIFSWIGEEKDENGQKDESENKKKKLVMGIYRLDPIIREAFQIPAFNPETGEGLTQDETIGIYSDYCEWKEAVKKNIEQQQISATSSDSQKSSSEESSTTSASMDCI